VYREFILLVRMLAAVIAALALSAGTAAATGVPEGAGQYYVLSFTGTPAAEAAEDVIVGSLRQSVSIDPAVDALVTFQAEGWFSDRMLLEEFGAALMEGNAALVRRGADLAIVPRSDLPAEILEGAVLIATPGPAAPLARPDPSTPPSAYRPVIYGAGRGTANWLIGVLIFAVGAVAGAAGLRAKQLVWDKRAPEPDLIVAPGLRLVSNVAVEPGAEDAGLTIPPMPRSRDSG